MCSVTERGHRKMRVLQVLTVLLALLLLLAVGVEWAYASLVWQSGQAAKPVELAVYYESLCPDSVLFMREQLYSAFEKLSTIFHLTLIPYGNAHEHYNTTSKQWDFECQHGPKECLGNVLQTCAIHVLGGSTTAFPFIYCMLTSTRLPAISGKECAQRFHLNYEQIQSCANGPVGNQLQHDMARQTESLDPPQNFIPWITINGIHTSKIQREAWTNLVELLCNSYKGPKPEPCKKMRLAHIRTGTNNRL